MLLTIFSEIPDIRRAQGKMYDLQHVLLFSVLAIVSEADSYRKIEIFIKENFKKLKKRFNLKWKKAPGYTTVRNIIQGVNPKELEKALRGYAKILANLKEKEPNKKYKIVSLDGKVVRGSFDYFQDKKAVQVFSAFLSGKSIILGHEEIDKKTNEIPVAQKLIKELKLKNIMFTADAMHCQKKL